MAKAVPALLAMGLGLGGILWLNAVSQPSQPDGDSLDRSEIKIDRRVPKYAEQIVVVAQPNTAETAKVTESVLYALSRRSLSNSRMAVEVVRGENINVLYDKKPNRRMMAEITQAVDGNPETKRIQPVASNDQGTIAAVQRFVDRVKNAPGHKINFILITAGSADAAVIQQIQNLLRPLTPESVKNARFYVIGLQADRRLVFSKAFGSIAQKVEFAGTNHNEWRQLLRRI